MNRAATRGTYFRRCVKEHWAGDIGASRNNKSLKISSDKSAGEGSSVEDETSGGRLWITQCLKKRKPAKNTSTYPSEPSSPRKGDVIYRNVFLVGGNDKN